MSVFISCHKEEKKDINIKKTIKSKGKPKENIFRRKKQMKKKESGITLIALIVMIVIIVILGAVTIRGLVRKP